MEFFNEHESYESHEFYKRGGLREDKKIGYTELKIRKIRKISVIRGRKRKGGLCGLKSYTPSADNRKIDKNK